MINTFHLEREKMSKKETYNLNKNVKKYVLKCFDGYLSKVNILNKNKTNNPFNFKISNKLKNAKLLTINEIEQFINTTNEYNKLNYLSNDYNWEIWSINKVLNKQYELLDFDKEYNETMNNAIDIVVDEELFEHAQIVSDKVEGEVNSIMNRIFSSK